MSESPKYSSVELEDEVQGWLFDERQRQGEREARLRKEYEEAERQRLARESAELAARSKAERNARESLDDLRATLHGLKADKIVLKWCNEDVAAAVGVMSKAGELLESESWEKASEIATKTKIKVETVIARAQARQLQENKRDYILRGMLETLAAMGFQTRANTQPGDPNSDFIIRARRPDGSSVQVQVPGDGDVCYRIQGYPMRSTRSVDGMVSRTCDEAVDLLESFQKEMQARFRVKMGEIRWHGKPTRESGKSVRELSQSKVNRGSSGINPE